MQFSHRGRGASRSWRRVCSCMVESPPSPRLVLLLVVYILLQSSHQSQAKYDHDIGDSPYYTFNCPNSTWCGEQWRRNRILEYTYSVTDILVVQNKTHTIHNNDCNGARDSLGCDSNKPTTEIEPKVTRQVTIQRSPEPEITKMSNTNLYLITTDNINGSNDTYPLNQDKIWQIHIPKGCKMTVYFSEFDLEVSERCQKDSFSVQYSQRQDHINRYCNNLHRIEFKTINRVQMTFHSDREVQGRGIKATACISNARHPESLTQLDQQLPCTCSPSTERRKKSSRPYKSLKRKIAEEENKVANWLSLFMQGGHDVVDEVLRNPENAKQRHLAERYREVLSKHRDW